ncbi:MAG TPA: hypothetical protein VN802_14865 [Stellaceae bacterium]|nr:hypothetical protein [Stellaceae bacterium]
MPNEDRFDQMTLAELLAMMRQYTTGDMRLDVLKEELERRKAVAQLAACSAQVRSAWFQLAAVLAMFATAAAVTVFFQWFAWAHPH